MRLARIIFVAAAIYGLLLLVPGLLVENTGGHAFLAQPEYYYGFYGLALAWQVGFLLIASDPLRYRPLMLVAVLEKATFFGACIALWSAGRLPGMSGPFLGAMIDGLLMLLFLLAWWVTPRAPLHASDVSNMFHPGSNAS
jgi:hypothetical protein